MAFLAGLFIILFGGVTVTDLAQIGRTVTLPLLGLLGLSIIALSVHEVGVFAWAARSVARISRGSGTRLFTNLYILSTVVTVLFPNDATILLFTPLVLRILLAVRDKSWGHNSSLPFLFIIVFGANAASIALVTSNPINMIFATHFGLPYLEYARLMVLPGLVSTLVCYVLLRRVCRDMLPRSYDAARPIQFAGEASRGERNTSAVPFAAPFAAPFAVAVFVVVGMFVSYFVLSLLGVSYHWAIFAGSGLILWPVRRTPGASLRRVADGLPWDEILFVAGMFVIAFGLTNSGLTVLLQRAMAYLANGTLLLAALGNSALVALGANLVNDWPMSLLSSLAIDSLPVDEATREGPMRQMLVYTAIISANLGNKIVPSGSLATLIWMGVIRRVGGLHISWGQFLRVGLCVTPLTLFAAVFSLWLELIIIRWWMG